jgi:DNA polymerase-1
VKPAALPAPGAEDTLYLVDLSGYVFRAYHAIPPLSAPNGEPTHATLGTLNMLSRLVLDHRPTYLAVAMDTPGRGFRAEIDPAYKANRPAAPPDLQVQMRRCREIADAYHIPVFARAGLEADDLIATVTARARAAGLTVVIASSDKDLMQLVEEERVLLWDAMRSSVYGPEEVRAKMGVGPERVRELLALVGDASDNVPGVPGVGLKTAAKLLGDFGSLDALFAGLDRVDRPRLRDALREHEPVVRRALALVTLRVDPELAIDLDALRYGGADVPRLRAIFEELAFSRFIEMLDRWGAPPPPAHRETPQPREPAPRVEMGAPRHETLTSADALGRLLDDARASGTLALLAVAHEEEPMRATLTGLALAPRPGLAAYVPVGHRYIGAPAQLARDRLFALLAPACADDRIAKIGHDLKFTEVLLARHGVRLAGARFDTAIASYLLDPEATHKLELVAERDAALRPPRLDATLGRSGRGPRATIDELEVERVGAWGATLADAILRLEPRYRALLERAELARLFAEVEMPLHEVLVQMELTGVGVDPAPLAALEPRIAADLTALEQRAHALADGEFNLASPKQLETILYDRLGLRASRKTKTGRSTDAEALEAIAEEHPLPAVILEHRALAKLKGTYVDALPKLLHPETARIHTRWEQAVAATGRLSSKDPNLQNIPVRTPLGKLIREAFVAPAGACVLSADYSQIELRLLAHLSHDPVLVEAFRRAEDVHVRTAMEVFGCKEDAVTPAMRAQSKTVNFGVIYGMGPVALAKRLDISRGEAKSFIDAYFARYHGVRAFMERTLAEAKRTKVVRTLLGRRRLLADIDSANHGKRSYAERIAQNTPIQGSAADLLKLAMVKLARPVVPGARMVLTVHDELVFEVPAERAEQAARETKTAMEQIHPLDVPLVVDVGHGRTWAEAH